MEPDPIVEEVRAIRDAFAKKHEYDVDAIVRALQKEQQDRGTKTVKLEPKRVADGDDARKAG